MFLFFELLFILTRKKEKEFPPMTAHLKIDYFIIKFNFFIIKQFPYFWDYNFQIFNLVESYFLIFSKANLRTYFL
jgi:hypothetical protein